MSPGVMLRQLVDRAFAEEMLRVGIEYREQVDGKTELMTWKDELEPFHSLMFSERMERTPPDCATAAGSRASTSRCATATTTSSSARPAARARPTTRMRRSTAPTAAGSCSSG